MTRETEHMAHAYMERSCCDGQCEQGRKCALPPPLSWREELKQIAVTVGLIGMASGGGVILVELLKVPK